MSRPAAPPCRLASARNALLAGALSVGLTLLLAPAPAGAALAGRIFAGTWGPAEEGQGRVFRYEDGTTWTELSPPGGLGDAVWDLEWHDEALWAVTHEGDAAYIGDIAGISDRPHGDNGRVFRYDGTGWTDHSPPGGFGSGATTVSSAAGRLFVTVDRDGLYRWEGGNDWTLLGEFIMGAQAIVSDSHDGSTPLLFVGQDNTDEFWVHDPSGAFPCGDWEGDPASFRTDCQDFPGDEVCSGDCWPGSCIHAFAEYDDGGGPLVYAGAWSRRMYRWEPTTRLFVNIADLEMAPDNGEPQHVQGLAPHGGRLWLGVSDGRLWSSDDPVNAAWTLEPEHEFGPENPISDLYLDIPDDLLWIGFGAVPWRWARHDGTSQVLSWDGSEVVQRGLPGEFADGVLQLLAVEVVIACDAGPEQVIECAGGETEVVLDGSATRVPGALGLETSFAWTGSFLEGTAVGPNPTVHFAGPGDHLVTLTVTAGEVSASCETVVHVVDTRPPSFAVRGACLWPPNHRYRCLGIDELTASGLPSATDECDGDRMIRIVDAYSSQPEEEVPLGDGNTQDDLLFGEFTVCVRGERLGADAEGRDYTVVLEAVDGAGNATILEVSIHVPHDQRPENRCPPRPVDPGFRPIDPLPLPVPPLEGRYPDPVRARRR